MANHHYIEKQILSLDFRGVNDKSNLLDDIAKLHSTLALDILEPVFDRIADEEHYISIDILEIDMGDISTGDFEKIWLRKLSEAIETALTKNNIKSFALGKEKSLEYILLFYLMHGVLPREAKFPMESFKKHSNELDEQFILHSLKVNAGLARNLRRILLDHEIALDRFIRQFSTDFQEKVIQLLLEAMPFELVSLNKRAAQNIKDVIQYQYVLNDSIQSALIRLMLSGTERQLEIQFKSVFITLSPSYFVAIYHPIINHLKELNAEELKYCIEEWPAVLQIQLNQQKDNAQLQLSLQEILISLITSNSYLPDKTKPFVRGTQDASIPKEGGYILNDPKLHEPIEPDHHIFYTNGVSSSIENPRLNEFSFIDTSKKIDHLLGIPKTTFYIENAGLILLSPFLPTLFNATGLTSEIGFVDDNARSKAVYLTQMLITGGWGGAEVDLLLNKLLCGLNPNWPLHKTVEMPENATIEAAQLLQTVIRHWTALKTTTIEGLQETFLKRPGRLTFDNGAIQLLTEYRTEDILLSSIPWSFSIVRLPWMADVIQCEWS